MSDIWTVALHLFALAVFVCLVCTIAMSVCVALVVLEMATCPSALRSQLEATRRTDLEVGA
jgi:hypothetical protein